MAEVSGERHSGDGKRRLTDESPSASSTSTTATAPTTPREEVPVCPACHHRSVRMTCLPCLKKGEFSRTPRAVDVFFGEAAARLFKKARSRAAFARGQTNHLCDHPEELVAHLEATAKASFKQKRDLLDQALKEKQQLTAKALKALQSRDSPEKTAHEAQLRQRKHEVQMLRELVLDTEIAVDGARQGLMLARQRHTQFVMGSAVAESQSKAISKALVRAGKDIELLQHDDPAEELADAKRERIHELMDVFSVTQDSIAGVRLPPKGDFITAARKRQTHVLGVLSSLIVLLKTLGITLALSLPFEFEGNAFDPFFLVEKGKLLNEDVMRQHLNELNYNLVYLLHQDGMDVTLLSPPAGQFFDPLHSLCAFRENDHLGHGEPTVEAELWDIVEPVENDFVLIDELVRPVAAAAAAAAATPPHLAPSTPEQ